VDNVLREYNSCVHQAQPSSATHNRNLNARAASYIKAALNEVTLSEIPEGYRHQWYEWMFTHVKTTPESSIPDGNEVNISLFKEERDAVDIIGQNLAGIMRGQVEPLSLLSQNGLLSSLYSNERCKACYVQMAAYCTELVKQGPNMKVLEIGAGTGSASEAMLGSLCPSGRSKITKYDFTDISSSFFEAARERLSAYSSVVDYRVLDIELDVANQGFEEGSYDLVIACNVIHATKELSNTIKRARSLLRPGGVFMLMEITKEEIYYNLVFGSLPGWWAGYEDGRKTSPLISDDQWKNTLQAHGFKNTAATFKDQSDDMGGTISVFVATATEAKTHIMPFPVEVVYYKKKSMQTQQLIDSLSKELNSENVQSSELEAASESLTTTIFLPEVCEVLATNITHSGWEAFRRRLLSSKAVLLLSKGATRDVTNPTAGLLAGYARCIRIEHPNIRLVTLDFDQSTEANTYATIIDGLLRSPSFDLKRTSSEVENEFSEHNGQLYVPRATHNEEVERHIRGVSGTLAPEMATFVDNGRTLYAQTEIPGLLDTIRWIPEETEAVLHPDEIRVELRAASINFKDVLIAAGQLEGITEMRNDCSGIVTEVGSNMKSRFRVGDAVCCYYSRSYTNQPRVHGDCCAIIPKNLSFEEAASLPIVWATVYYSLVDQGRLKSGETVLIHSAAGAVGQAAIMLAQHLGAEVYATVSSQQKKKFLMETYGLAEDHIFSSRSTAFGRKIRQATSKGGVDVVLNSLGGDMFRESCNSVAPYGRFVEIGRKDFQDDMLMPTRFLLRNITFAYVDLALLIEDNKPLVKRLLQDVIYLMASGAVRPTSITTMPISDMETAFRQIQAGKHIGKVILTVEEGQQAKVGLLQGADILPDIDIVIHIDNSTSSGSSPIQAGWRISYCWWYGWPWKGNHQVDGQSRCSPHYNSLTICSH
jgi:emericellamide synthase (highly reducing iterative type I polyketide synthase)